ncbi:cupin domain-containing protein [Micromonospora schwarzwaldensis]|uniref:hypothetical protein n=1 Tax=Micromonospora sp. DSM 45708 TaxID=3111767 RepID=UPI0031CF0A5A
MTTGTGTAVRRYELVTGDPDLAHHTIAQAYAEHRPRFAGSRRGFRFALRTVQDGPLGLDRIVHSMDARARTGPYPDFMTVHVLRGRFRFTDGDEEWLAPAGAVARYPQRPSVLGWTDVVGTMIRLPHQQVAHVATTRTETTAANFRFLGLAGTGLAGRARRRAGRGRDGRRHRPPLGLDQPRPLRRRLPRRVRPATARDAAWVTGQDSARPARQ